MTDLPDNTRWQLWIVAFGFFMQSLDTTIVNTALPSMAQSLGESPLHMHMVIVSYVLTVAVMLPASGWLADKVGVRNIFFTAIVLFTLGSLFCALSGTLNELLLARALQGVGGAMMVPVGRLTVMKIVPREQYMAAMTFVTLPGQVGPLLGPALGGLLVEYASWHWIFLINIPVGIIGAIATLMLMPNYTMQTRRFDLSGFLLLARALQGVGGAMMVPVGRLTVMKIVPREQYMAAMTFVTLPGQVGPLLGPALGGLLVEYASWHWIFLINIPVGIIGAIATLMLMPNYTMQTRRFDLSGFLLLAIGMAVLTLALDGSKGTGLSPLAITGLVAVGVVALVLYLLHARNNNRALFSLKLFRTRTFSLGLAGSFAGRIGSGMLPFMTPVFLQIGLGFSPFHAGLMMIPMVLGSMGMKRIVVQVVNRFGYRRVLVATTLGLSLVTLLFMTTALLGWYYVLPFVLFLQGMVNSTRFSSMNTLTLKDLPDNLASSGNSLLSMIMQLSMSIGVTIAGLLLGLFGSQHVSVDSGTTQTVFMYTWLSMALIIALPAFIFARVPNDTHQNVAISRRKRSAQ